jgi:type I restriction enzyme M protein
MGPHGVGKIHGQEKNITTYNLARMNMLLHGVKDSEFEIFHGDTLTNDWDFLRETNPAKMPRFDAVVANPPFSYRWEPTEVMGEDVRFENYDLALKFDDCAACYFLWNQGSDSGAPGWPLSSLTRGE